MLSLQFISSSNNIVTYSHQVLLPNEQMRIGGVFGDMAAGPQGAAVTKPYDCTAPGIDRCMYLLSDKWSLPKGPPAADEE